MSNQILAGKNALVTGATGHLGNQMAFDLAHAGAHVYVNSRSKDRCHELVEALHSEGLRASAAPFDVTDTFAIAAFLRELRSLHILVNNAYVGGAGSIVHAASEQYQESYSVTVSAAHSMLTNALTSLRRAVDECGDASVINIASMYGLVTPDRELYRSSQDMNPPFYGAAKAALIHWSQYAAKEFAPLGIRVNCISPGPFPSQETQDAQPEFVARLADRVPLARIGKPEDLSGPLLLLASQEASFITGSNIVVDGGWTC